MFFSVDLGNKVTNARQLPLIEPTDLVPGSAMFAAKPMRDVFHCMNLHLLLTILIDQLVHICPEPNPHPRSFRYWRCTHTPSARDWMQDELNSVPFWLFPTISLHLCTPTELGFPFSSQGEECWKLGIRNISIKLGLTKVSIFDWLLSVYSGSKIWRFLRWTCILKSDGTLNWAQARTRRETASPLYRQR